MSQDPPSLHYKDQIASVAAERRRSRPCRDPDGALLAAKYGTHQAGTVESPHSNNFLDRGVSSSRTSKRPSSVAAVAETVIPIAFPVVDSGDSITGSNNNNNSNESAANNHDHHQKSCRWKTAIASLMLIAIAAAVVGGVCGSGGCGGISADADNAGPVPTPAPTSTRAQDITNFINSNSYKGVALSPTGTSPEERAMQWLINDDPLQLNIGVEVDEFRLLQRYSLLTLWFQAETGTAWDDSTNWLTANECTWYGIFCQLGVVTEVDFYQNELQVANGLGGSLSPDLGLLTDLEYFDVDNNTLTGSLPSQIGLWTNLREFFVTSNFLTGSLPLDIGLWTNLKKFEVFDNRLTGSLPSEIGLWTILEWFDVYDNRLTGFLPSEIGLWTNLESFTIFKNSLKGSLPSEIGLWTNLVWFNAHTNLLTGSLPPAIGLWTNIAEVFYISNNLLTGSLPSTIGSWTSLMMFAVSMNNLTGSLPSEIGLCTNLVEFDVESNDLTGIIPETIANWTFIEFAFFYDNKFSGSMPDGICDFISGNDVLEADCDLNCSCCTKCW